MSQLVNRLKSIAGQKKGRVTPAEVFGLQYINRH